MHSNTYRKQYQRQFSKITDTDEQDSICLDEFRERLIEKRRTLPFNDCQIDKLCNAVDKSGQNRINIEEFSKLITSKEAQPSPVARALYVIADQYITDTQRVDVHSYIDEYTLCPPPIFILIATILEILVFVYYFVSLPENSNADIWTYCAGCSHGNKYGIFLFVPALREQAWRFITYALLHSGLLHLLGNVIIQLLVGIPLEIVHKIWRIAPLYILAVASGALLQYVIDSSVLLAGASAGVYALITAHLANVFLNWSEMPFRWIRLVLLAVFLSYDIGGVLYKRYVLGDCDMISHAAHFAGGFTGFCFGVGVLYNIVDHKYEKVVRYLCIAAFTVFFVAIVLLAIFRAPNSAPLIQACIAE